jgi:predicted permease
VIRPPRLASWLLSRAIPDRRREVFLGDLEELFQARARHAGRASARRWYWRQTVHALTETPRHRRRAPRAPAGDSIMQTIIQDVRYAFRSLRARPGFAAVAVLMLALGIGANATIFSWVNTVLLDPLPGTGRHHELVQLSYLYRGDVMTSFSYPDYQDIRAAAKQLRGVAGRDDLRVGIVIDREAEPAWAEIVTANFFEVLEVPIVNGRGFVAADDVPGTPGVVVLSHDFWQRRFSGSADAIGRQVKINAQPFTIVGIAPRGFQGGDSGLKYDMWVPIGTQPAVSPGGSRLESRGSRWMSVLARLAPGATPDRARAEFDALLNEMRQAWASQKRYIDHRAGVFTLDRSPTGGVSVLRPVLLILTVVAAIVLLIACANLAGLLLARASARQREFAIRLSMGAGRWRIVQQLLVEGALLAGLGAIGAVLALQWTSGLLMGFAPPSELPLGLNVEVDARVLGFTVALAIGTVLLFALAPAAQAARTDVATLLREAGNAGRAFGRHRLRRALVAAQVALSISLLVGAGLCIRSLDAAARMSPGFVADGVVVGWLDMFSAGYTAATGRPFYTRLLERVRALPGVESVSLSRRIPLGFMGSSFSDVTIEGYTPPENDVPGVGLNYAGPDYARTMRIPLIAGRDLSNDDVDGRPLVALVSESAARAFWKDRDAVGGRFIFGQLAPGQQPEWITVAGVFKDVKQRSLTERPAPNVLVPMLQLYSSTAVLTVRTAGTGNAVAGELQRVMHELDPSVPFYNVSRLADHTRAATFQQKLAADLLVVFGAVALLLAGIGSYGVLSYLVGLRRREIGIRLAVGATRADVFRLVAGSGARLIAAGAATGLVLSIAVGMGLESLLIGISPRDPLTYAGVLGVLTIVAAAACLLPARRAASVDPAITLRED